MMDARRVDFRVPRRGARAKKGEKGSALSRPIVHEHHEHEEPIVEGLPGATLVGRVWLRSFGATISLRHSDIRSVPAARRGPTVPRDLRSP